MLLILSLEFFDVGLELERISDGIEPVEQAVTPVRVDVKGVGGPIRGDDMLRFQIDSYLRPGILGEQSMQAIDNFRR